MIERGREWCSEDMDEGGSLVEIQRPGKRNHFGVLSRIPQCRIAGSISAHGISTDKIVICVPGKREDLMCVFIKLMSNEAVHRQAVRNVQVECVAHRGKHHCQFKRIREFCNSGVADPVFGTFHRSVEQVQHLERTAVLLLFLLKRAWLRFGKQDMEGHRNAENFGWIGADNVIHNNVAFIGVLS